jgi:hypothetical protein
MIGFVRLASPHEATVFALLANLMKSSDDMLLARLVDQAIRKTGRENDCGVPGERDQIRSAGRQGAGFRIENFIREAGCCLSQACGSTCEKAGYTRTARFDRPVVARMEAIRWSLVATNADEPCTTRSIAPNVFLRLPRLCGCRRLFPVRPVTSQRQYRCDTRCDLPLCERYQQLPCLQ